MHYDILMNGYGISFDRMVNAETEAQVRREMVLEASKDTRPLVGYSVYSTVPTQSFKMNSACGA